MLKRLSSIFLILLIVCSTFTRLFYFAGYELNKDYIAQNLCVNKNKPELHCNGKCFLSRKIAEAEQKQQSQEKKTQKDLFQQIMLTASLNIIFFNNVPLEHHFDYHNHYQANNYSSIFHPPPMV